ncbi:MAG: HPr family phosphocarrier protein [Phycisphaerae bacterium]|nr:HPr family phosphocarrier protein [Phycisphaerae bacterium]
MVTGRATILNRLGLHARPAMSFVQTAMGFSCTVTVRRTDGDETVDGKSIMQMLLVAGTAGTELEITCDGTDEDAAMAALLRLIARKFDEE